MSEGKSFASTSSRHRSPVFTQGEINLLLKLIEKYKHIVMNKSVRSSACQQKEETWAKISRQFNKNTGGIERSALSLKLKWDNLKKETKKLYYNNVFDSELDYSVSNSVHAQIASLMSETHNSVDGNDDPVIPDEDDGYLKGEDQDQDLNWIKRDKQDGETSGEENNSIRKKNRSSNFSSSECSLLLKCIREEKDDIFAKDNSGKAVELKNQAWLKVTSSYNKLSPRKRSTKMLRNKFKNLKKMAHCIGSKEYLPNFKRKHDKLIEDTKDIKTEPQFSLDTDVDWLNSCEDVDLNKSVNNSFNFAPDPLSSVLNGDSGMGSSHTNSINLDNPEVMKLKLDLLNYQMETAKMERKRIENLIQEDAKTRESRAIETALRLRAARLNAIAAEARLPPSHPSLHYASEETPAQQYLNQYTH